MFVRGLVVLLLFTALGFGVVWQRIHVTRLGYAVQDLSRARRLLEEENRRLTYEISAFSAPDQIIRRIRESDTGLMPPSSIVQLSGENRRTTEEQQ